MVYVVVWMTRKSYSLLVPASLHWENFTEIYPKRFTVSSWHTDGL